MAGITDWIMSLRKWQKLMVSRMRRTRSPAGDRGSLRAGPDMAAP